MTTLSVTEALGAPSPNLLTGERADAVLGRYAILLALLAVPTLATMGVDTRTFNGVNVWLKPFKFELSLAIYALTLSFFASFTDSRRLESRTYRLVVAAFVAVTAFNVGYIIFRASRAEASHFNADTPIADALYKAMGLGALVQVGLAVLIGIAVLRSEETRLAPELRLSIGVGMIAAAALTLVCGGYMSVSGSHWVGGLQSDADGVPFFGWSRTGGDLRIAHFLGMHAMHVLPLAGLAAAGLREAARQGDHLARPGDLDRPDAGRVCSGRGWEGIVSNLNGARHASRRLRARSRVVLSRQAVSKRQKLRRLTPHGADTCVPEPRATNKRPCDRAEKY